METHVHVRGRRGGRTLCVSNTGSQDSANAGSASGGPRAPRYGQLAGRSVFNTPLSFFAEVSYYFLPSWVSRCLTSLVRVFQLWLQDRGAGEPVRGSRGAGRPKPRHAKVVVRPCRPSLWPARALREERPRVRANRFGLGQLIRAEVRLMAGDSPSGYSLAGQSGLV